MNRRNFFGKIAAAAAFCAVPFKLPAAGLQRYTALDRGHSPNWIGEDVTSIICTWNAEHRHARHYKKWIARGGRSRRLGTDGETGCGCIFSREAMLDETYCWDGAAVIIYDRTERSDNPAPIGIKANKGWFKRFPKIKRENGKTTVEIEYIRGFWSEAIYGKPLRCE